jgi:HEAT repeat protein
LSAALSQKERIPAMIVPSQYDNTPVYDLLAQAEAGLIGFDQRLLASITGRPEEAVEALARFSSEIRTDAVVDLDEQFFDLFRHFKSPAAIPFYIHLFRLNPSEVPDVLVEAFVDLGAAAIDPLLELHAELEEEDRGDVAFLLAGIGVPDPRIRALIEETIAKDPYEGALCAGLSRDIELKPALELALADCSPEMASERQAITDALSELGNPAPVRESTFDLFALYPERALPIFEAIEEAELVPYFTCEDLEWRAGAMESLIDEQIPDAVRDALMDRVNHDEEPLVRASGLRALSTRSGESKVRDLMLSVVSDSTAPAILRGAALVSLSARSTLPEFQKALMELYEDEVEGRTFALEAMWNSTDLRFKKYFAPNLRHENVAIRRQAIQGVAAYPISELVSELVPLLADEEVREDALFAYCMAMQAKIEPKTVERLFKEVEDKADGFTVSEGEMVAFALDRRLELNGFEPHFMKEGDDEHDHDHDHGDDSPAVVAEPGVNGVNGLASGVTPISSAKVGRNDPCPCGSGKKYKKCCGQ